MPFVLMLKFAVSKLGFVFLGMLATVALVTIAMGGFLRFSDLTPKAEKFLSIALGQPVLIRGGLTTGMIWLVPSLEAKDVLIGQWSADSVEVSISLWQGRKEGRFPLSVDLSDLVFNKKELGDLSAIVILDGKRIEAYPKSRDFIDGKLNGEIHYDGRRLTVEGLLEKADTTFFWPDYHGRASARVSLSGNGANAKDIIRTLSGRIDIIGDKGALSSKGLDFWAAELLPALMGDKAKGTTLNCLIGYFDVKAGIASGQNILLDSSQVTVMGRGGIDLNDQTINFLLTPKSKNPSFVSLATPIRIRGTLDSPDAYPDPKGSAIKLGTMLLSAANPIIAAGAFVMSGSLNDDPCAKAFEEGRQRK